MSQLYITEPTIDRSWYTIKDEQQFHENARYEMVSYLRAKQAAQDTGVPLEVLCPVGLEKQLISRDFCKKRAFYRKLVLAAVRMEQRVRYSHEDEYDRQDRIAAASTRYSEWSRSQALMIGSFQSTGCMQD